jgi:predicted nucleic acid-binding protein
MRAAVAVDTSVLVAGVLTWHEHHQAAREVLERGLAARALVVPVPALVESYAVMTRLPAPHRLSPADAHALLRENFGDVPTVPGLTGPACWKMLDVLAAAGVAGGRTYDAQILAVALERRATVLLTLNPSDFTPMAPDAIEIRSPLE